MVVCSCGWLLQHGACLKQPCWAASSRVTVITFGNSSHGTVESSNLFAAPQEAVTKFSAVHLPLKRRVSKMPLHNAPILDRESELCASQTIGSHPKLTHRWWAPHQQLPTLSGDTSFPPWHVDVGWQEDRLAACGTEPCTPVRERKAVGRKPDQRWQKAELGKSTAPYIYEGQRNRHSHDHTLIGRLRSRPRGWESIKNRD